MSKIKIYALGLILFIAVYEVGYFKGYRSGQRTGQIETLKAVVAAKKIREEIDHATENLSPVDVCIALGGLRDDCTNRLRRMDTPADSQ